VWDDHEYYVLNAIKNLDVFYDDMLPYLLSFGIDKDVFDDLLNYQKAILRTPFSPECRVKLRYDVHKFLTDVYINDIHKLRPKTHTLIMRDSDPACDWGTFGKKVVWYGRMGWASYKDDVKEEAAQAQ
jgi:hypothetical protein